MENNLIKVCGDPHCEAVYHNCKKETKKCNDCGGTLKMINQNTYQKKYKYWYFQYDCNTGGYYRPC